MGGGGDCKIQIPTETLNSVQCMSLNVDLKPDEFQWMYCSLLICFDNAMETYGCGVIFRFKRFKPSINKYPF